ncbi:MAG: hypothetical protein H6686_09480 [Fibrobacteria bacterium]|nr:hypothetical protein [Fibrobacteria bacterium]
MRTFLFALLLGTSFLVSCDSSSPSTTEPVTETVTIAPRLVGLEAIPVPLYDGTARIHLQVSSTNTSFSLDTAVEFSRHSCVIAGVPAQATITLSIQGMDAAGTILWSGTRTGVSAADAAKGMKADNEITVAAAPSVAGYLDAGSWTWSNGNMADSAMEVIEFDATGDFTREYRHFRFDPVLGGYDTIVGATEVGTFLQKGDTLVLSTTSYDTCAASNLGGNECGESSQTWAAGNLAPRRFTWVTSGSRLTLGDLSGSWNYTKDAPVGRLVPLLIQFDASGSSKFSTETGIYVNLRHLGSDSTFDLNLQLGYSTYTLGNVREGARFQIQVSGYGDPGNLWTAYLDNGVATGTVFTLRVVDGNGTVDPVPDSAFVGIWATQSDQYDPDLDQNYTDYEGWNFMADGNFRYSWAAEISGTGTYAGLVLLGSWRAVGADSLHLDFDASETCEDYVNLSDCGNYPSNFQRDESFVPTTQSAHWVVSGGQLRLTDSEGNSSVLDPFTPAP